MAFSGAKCSHLDAPVTQHTRDIKCACAHMYTQARTDIHTNVRSQVVNIAKEYTDQLSSAKVMELLEKQNAWPGLYFYLGSRLATSEVRHCPHGLRRC